MGKHEVCVCVHCTHTVHCSYGTYGRLLWEGSPWKKEMSLLNTHFPAIRLFSFHFTTTKPDPTSSLLISPSSLSLCQKKNPAGQKKGNSTFLSQACSLRSSTHVFEVHSAMPRARAHTHRWIWIGCIFVSIKTEAGWLAGCNNRAQ